jgi:hypothetical protein
VEQMFYEKCEIPEKDQEKKPIARYIDDEILPLYLD